MEIERHLYEKVIDSLVHMHVNAGPDKASQPLAGFKLKFDLEKLMWEVGFTIEHFYKLHLQRHISPKDQQVLDKTFTAICTELANEPAVFTHRDFHSRNVMVPSDERLVMIDFQDARMGPPQYDLASLLRDSYYQLNEDQVQRLIDYYLARYEALSGQKLQRQHFLRLFDLMAVQRNFKAIGSFASFQNKRGVATYLKYVGNTFENIRRTLLKYPEFSELREVLFHYYYF
jgi:aminoglycoside/choline kinase family phosphotransferase